MTQPTMIRATSITCTAAETAPEPIRAAAAGLARRTDPASFRLDEPPANAERDLGRALGQAFHQGCSLADIALATGLPPGRVVAIGKRTIRRTGWLSRMADPDLA